MAKEKHVIDAIVTAALQELRDLGIRGFRTRGVARIAKVSLGTVTHYFPKKEKLLDSVAELFLNKAWKNFDANMQVVDEQGLAPVVSGFYAICRRNQTAVRLIVHYSARDGQVWGMSAARMLAPVLARVETQLGRKNRLLAHSVISMIMVYSLYTDEQVCILCDEPNTVLAQEQIVAHLQVLAELA